MTNQFIKQSKFKDLDGSLTGTAGTRSLTGNAGAIVTTKDASFDPEANCNEKSGWNLQVCQGRYVKVSLNSTQKGTWLNQRLLDDLIHQLDKMLM